MKKIIFGMLVLVFGMIGSASALTFGLDSYSVTLNETDPGLKLYYEPLLPTPTSFDLEVGEWKKFDLFRIGTDETWVNDDDKVAKPISVDFDFYSPDVKMTATGETVGKWFVVGNVEWDNPTEFYFGTTGLLTLTLTDAMFSTFGCDGIVSAKFTYETGDTAPVPEPSTMLLLGAGLLGIVGYSRKKSSKKVQ